MSWTEIAGFVTGALCVWLGVRENPWNFPVGIANNVLFVALFVPVGLYADASLQVVYVVLAVLGWYWWLRGGHGGTELPVQVATVRQVLASLGLLVVLTALFQFALARWTNSTVAGWDAVTTALSLVAQLMLNRKWIQNWLFWMTADVIYIGLYIYKGLWLTGGLYLLFLGLCVAGLLRWRQSLRQDTGQRERELVSA